MARIPTPSAIHEENGSFEHDPARRRARELEPVPTGPLGEPPSRLQDVLFGVEAWREITMHVPDGVLTISDRHLVEIIARLLARMWCGEDLKAAEIGVIFNGLAHMGMTPAARTKLAAPKPDKPGGRFGKFKRDDVQ